MDRRQVLAGVAGTALVAATPAVAGTFAKIVGVNDRTYQSEKFTGPAWHAIGDPSRPYLKRVFWAFRDGHPFIALSDGPDKEVTIYLSHRGFDHACWGICMSADEADRRAGTERYRGEAMASPASAGRA